MDSPRIPPIRPYFGLLSALYWERQRDGCALPLRGLDGGPALVRFHDTPDNRQSQPGAFRLSRVQQRRERLLRLVQSHPFARILEFDFNGRVVRARRNARLAARSFRGRLWHDDALP